MACINGNSPSSNILYKTEATNDSDQISPIESKTANIALPKLLKILPKELLDVIIHYFPARTSEEVAGCIPPMQLFWAPAKNSLKSKVFSSICAKKFADWVNKNAIPVDHLGFSHHTNSGQALPLQSDLTKVLPLLKLQENDLECYEDMQKRMCHFQELGLLASLPSEALDLIVDKLPAGSSAEVAPWLEPMKLFWKVFPDASPEQVVFGTIDPIKMATWIGSQRLPIAAFGLSNQDLCNVLPHLEYLDLSQSRSFPFELLENCKKIKTLIIGKSLELSNEDLRDIVENLSELTSLSLMNSSSLEDEEIEYLLTYLSKIETLRLYRLINLTDQGLKPISKLKHLTSLAITQCPKLGLWSIKRIGTLKNLERLGLQHLDIVNDMNLCYISKLKKLKVLNYMGCPNLTGGALYLLSEIEKLEMLYLIGCSQLKSARVEALKNLRPDVKIFE